MVGPIGFEPMTNGYLQLQNFVIPPKGSAYPFWFASGAHRNTWLYYDPYTFTEFLYFNNPIFIHNQP
jgi:hypothetical protein